MKINVISEGDIDFILLQPLIQAIANSAGLDWPISAEDYTGTVLRKRGYGAVAEGVARVVETSEYLRENFDLYIVVLDSRKTQGIIKNIKRRISHIQKIVLGIAIEEIEVWWLGDRKQVLGWLRLSAQDAKSVGYGADYRPEADINPKSTLDNLTEVSEQTYTRYGEGNRILAEEFVDVAWLMNVNLDHIQERCPRGFRPFYQTLARSFAPFVVKRA